MRTSYGTILPLSGLVVCAFILGSRTRHSNPTTRQPFPVGSTLPSFVVQSPDGPVMARDLIRKDDPTVLIIFWIGCDSCLGEAEIWKAMEARWRGARSFVALPCGTTLTDMELFNARAKPTFPVFLCERDVRERLRADGSPMQS